MAILDAKTIFSREASLVGSGTVIKGSTTWSGSIDDGHSQVVDQEKAGDAVGQELTIKAVVGGTTNVAGTTASTAQIKIQTSDTTTDGDFTDLVLSPVISIHGAVPGTVLFECRIPSGSKRYLRATVAVSGASVTAGALSIYATRDL